MIGFIELQGQRYELEAAALELYHCAGPVADWSLGLSRGAQRLWLAGTVEPAPISEAQLHTRRLWVELRSLDEVFGALTGKILVHDPPDTIALDWSGGELSVAYTFEWSCGLGPSGRDGPEPGWVRIHITPQLVGMHPGALPGA